ncbi:methyltransferase domain-containing protein [Acaryochloris sp. IP29b_bin.148]|uniref:class I SAM-dependent methyltransferase n=1 Tax=Acaryochloris sp. IP29b_bin.148 TaxID=2969218 RepID=UPI002620B0B9|nr:methyltransferase domain-containing protein [Acaryochloris sp. IP29b_bin.148]
MKSSVTEHYANHLAPIYSWMVGDFDAASSDADSFYSDIALPSGNGLIAVDLGCGHGVHSIPLARRGYSVLALDTSRHLLDELETKIGELSIKAIAADLIDFTNHLGSDAAALIVCMGDTLTHLPSVEAVKTLIRDSARMLSHTGLLTLSFRDYSHELIGSERFIPVRSDDRRIHTCFLEYQSDVVIVHDIIHSLNDSAWQTSVSAYPKLRLHPDTVVAFAESSGLALAHKQTVRGMYHFAFNRKTAIAG